MSRRLTIVLVTVTISVVLLALILLWPSSTSPIGVPIVKACEGDGDCTPQTCMDCVECHMWLKRCTYKLKDSEHCNCVPAETTPCVFEGGPGKHICAQVGLPTDLHTEWGPCGAMDAGVDSGL